MSANPANLVAGRTERLMLVALALLVSAGHVAHLPLWLSALAGALFVWQIAAHTVSRGTLPGWLRVALTGVVFAAVFFGLGQITGQTAGVALLTLMTALKLGELGRSRDGEIVLLLSCFVLATEFLFSQSLAMALYLVVGVWAIVYVFVYLHCLAGADRGRHALRESGLLVGLAVPLAAVCFVMFPRLPGPLWSLPSDDGAAATTGLSERMSPGAISSLARSDAVAFRARFDGPVPPPGQRYWRGPVLWDYDDGTWFNQARRSPLPSADVEATGPVRSVTITLEANGHRWLIALDTPLAADRSYSISPGAMLLAEDKIDERIRYTARSAPSHRIDATLPAAARRRALALPNQGNPRTRRLAERLAAKAGSPRATIDAALAWFQARDFSYTLSPPRTSRRDGIDDFLFDTRTGFCEHYAGALVYLMRAAGLPARVVTGYLGGEAASYGDYWIVRNADAHAWAEVWLDGPGWVRVDATQAVAPSRIERGVSASVNDPETLGFMSRGDRIGGWLYRSRMLWDAVNAGWNQWFLAYGPALQDTLMKRLGLRNQTAVILALTAAITTLLALISGVMIWRMRPARSRDPVIAAWHRIERHMTRAGHPPATGETATAWAHRVAAEREHDAGSLIELAERYERLRYASSAGPDEHADFLDRARRFRA